MMITRENYEIWFLDYLEGSLNHENKDLVYQFLIANPDLADGLEPYTPVLTVDTLHSYPHKERLKKTLFDDPGLLESTAVAAMEGDLTDEEQNEFQKWLENKPDSRRLMNITGTIRLQPDLKIHFPDKERLKRTSIISSFWIRTVAVAAILVLAFFIFGPSVVIDETSYPITAESKITVKKNDPVSLTITSGKPSNLSAEKSDGRKMATGSPAPESMSKHHSEEPVLAENRSFVPIGKLEPKSGAVTSNAPVFADLILIRRSAPVYYASGEIPLSDFFNHRLQEMKASQPKEILTREEFKVAGLRLFSHIPGKHLTGKKGKDGRLKSISFNTQILAFSIPVNQ
jgi:hypothetical protein